MNKLIAILLSSLFATAAFAAAHTGAAPMPEAMKPGSPKAEAAAQAKVDAKVKTGDKTAMQPEAMKPGSAKAQAKAEAKHKKKAHTGKKNSTDEQQAKDAKKL